MIIKITSVRENAAGRIASPQRASPFALVTPSKAVSRHHFEYILSRCIYLPKPRALYALHSLSPSRAVCLFRKQPRGQRRFSVSVPHALVIAYVDIDELGKKYVLNQFHGVIWHTVIPAITHDSAKKLITKGLGSPLQVIHSFHVSQLNTSNPKKKVKNSDLGPFACIISSGIILHKLILSEILLV